MSLERLRPLLAKLNPLCKQALERGAIPLCMTRSNYNVEVEHWLAKLLEAADSDLVRIAKQYDITLPNLNRQVTAALDKLKRGNAKAPGFSEELTDLMQAAWLTASLDYKVPSVRSGHLLLTLLTDPKLSESTLHDIPDFRKIEAADLKKKFNDLVAESPESEMEQAAAAVEPSGGPGAPRPDSKTPSLDQFTENLTEKARKGTFDPVIGRDFEIRQVMDILTRRRQNNPLLAGEAGVGKTAVVEGFAMRIAAGDVPPSLKNVELLTLDLALLQAGAGVKGEFENRLKSVISEVKSSPKPIILFIDEAHTLIGAGGAAVPGDAANLLKPALARGELRTVAATTWAEYKKSFEADPALKRRFQVVKVEEPDVDKAIRMMRGWSNRLEKHHKVRIMEEAICDAVKLSHRYITDRQLPDKCSSLLDTACGRVGLAQSATPAPLEDCIREIEFADVEIGILEREAAVGVKHEERLGEVKEIKKKAEERKTGLEKRWAEEKKLVEKIQELRGKLEAHASADNGQAKLSAAEESKARAELLSLQTDLKKKQGDTPLVLPVVDSQAVAEVVSSWTGIPVGRMVLDEIKTVLNLKEKLEERIIGQSHALDAIAQRIRTSRANLTDPRKPIGVFFMVGSSGVGKTETALALSDILYGGDRNMVIINMSEYKESHKISRLTGSAPGYVGYGEGGVLTEAVRRKPYSIVLLDEVEKSHPDVQEVFYQVFDKGMLQDDKGEEINFKNTIIILTSNVGTETIMKLCADPDTMPDAAGLAEALRPDLLKVFKPALLGRMSIVPYFPLSDEVIRKIITLKVGQVRDRVKEHYKATCTIDAKVYDTIAARCKEVESGARNIDQIISGTLLPEMSKDILEKMARGEAFSGVTVSVNDAGAFTYSYVAKD